MVPGECLQSVLLNLCVLKIIAWVSRKKGLALQVIWSFSCLQVFNNFVVVFPSSQIFSALWIKCDLVGEWTLSCFPPLLNPSHDDKEYLNKCKSFILFLTASQASFSQALQGAPAGDDDVSAWTVRHPGGMEQHPPP